MAATWAGPTGAMEALSSERQLAPLSTIKRDEGDGQAVAQRIGIAAYPIGARQAAPSALVWRLPRACDAPAIATAVSAKAGCAGQFIMQGSQRAMGQDRNCTSRRRSASAVGRPAKTQEGGKATAIKAPAKSKRAGSFAQPGKAPKTPMSNSKDENARHHCGKKACRPQPLESERGPGKVQLASEGAWQGSRIHDLNIIA